MEFTTKTVRSRPGLSQEEALSSLQSHPLFKQGTRIQSIRKRGKVWVAELLEPVTAGGFPPSNDEPSDSAPSGPPSSDSPDSPSDDSSSEPSDSSSESDAPSGPPTGDKPKPKSEGEGSTDKAMLHVLQQILHALQGGEPEPSIGGPDDLGPGGPPSDGPDGGAGLSSFGDSPAGGSGPGAKLKPGEVANRPGAVPLGAPAFASTKQANPLDNNGVTPGGPAQSPQQAGSCPPGFSLVNGQCVPNAPQGTPGSSGPSAPGAGPMHAATYTVSRTDTGLSIKEAKAELEAQFQPHGYKVARIKREDGRIRALVTKR